jgi:hypothetical protein
MVVFYLDENHFNGRDDLLLAFQFVLKLIKKVEYDNSGSTGNPLAKIDRVTILIQSQNHLRILNSLLKETWLKNHRFIQNGIKFEIVSGNYTPYLPSDNKKEILMSVCVEGKNLNRYDCYESVLYHIVVPLRLSEVSNYLTEHNAVPIQKTE